MAERRLHPQALPHKRKIPQVKERVVQVAVLDGQAVPPLFPESVPWEQVSKFEVSMRMPNLHCRIYKWTEGYTVAVGYRTWLSPSLEGALQWARSEVAATASYIKNIIRG